MLRQWQVILDYGFLKSPLGMVLDLINNTVTSSFCLLYDWCHLFMLAPLARWEQNGAADLAFRKNNLTLTTRVFAGLRRRQRWKDLGGGPRLYNKRELEHLTSR